MGFSLGKLLAFCAIVAVIAICSCEKHHPGEFSHVQRDRTEPAAGHGESHEEHGTAPHASPAAQPTPAEFFPSPR